MPDENPTPDELRARGFTDEEIGKIAEVTGAAPAPTIWKIAIRDGLRAAMATDPDPYWAVSESERDWALTHRLHRPREDYVVEEVPGPVARAMADERVRWRRVRVELRQRKAQTEEAGRG